MKNIVYLFTLPLLLSCQSDDNSFTKDIDFRIDNILGYDVDGKIYTTVGSSDRKQDSTDFVVKAGEATMVSWNRPDMRGEGSFIVHINQELNNRFGYFTNGVSVSGLFTITIAPDSIVVVQ